MPPDHTCVMEERIKQLEKANESHSGTHEKMYDRIRKLETDNAVQTEQFSQIIKKLDKMTDKIESMNLTIVEQAQSVIELNERGKKNQARLDELESKPGKKWETMSDKFTGGIVGGISALLVSGIVLLLAFASGLINLG